jgi:hypothetical protein
MPNIHQNGPEKFNEIHSNIVKYSQPQLNIIKHSQVTKVKIH